MKRVLHKIFRRKYLRYLWVTIVVILGLSFIIGQVAVYFLYAQY